MIKYIFLIILVGVCKSSETYGSLSERYVPKSYNDFTSKLSILHDGIKPGSLTSLRRSIIAVRSFLDIFIYAYPLDVDDTALILRKDMNKLYTDIGNFDDLHFVKYDPHDAEKLLKKCLNAKSNYDGHDKKYGYSSYINRPSKDKIHIRDKDKLSIDFWGHIPVIPTEGRTGVQTLGELAKGQLKILLEGYTKFVNLTDVCNKAIHEQFHDYRKLIRGFNFVGSYFDDIFNRTVKLTPLSDAYHKIGKINDMINQYLFYISKGNNDKAETIKKHLNIDWQQLQLWFNEVHLHDLMVSVYNSIIS